MKKSDVVRIDGCYYVEQNGQLVEVSQKVADVIAREETKKILERMSMTSSNSNISRKIMCNSMRASLQA